MRIHIGEVVALFRYPVKSMRGETLDTVSAGWHGLDGDRRVAVRRLHERGGFPWLTASRLPELLCFAPERRDPDSAASLPTHVRTPEGQLFELFGPELAAEIGGRHGAPVEMAHLDRGIFDEAPVSIISTSTIEALGAIVEAPLDTRRFRPNVLIATRDGRAFEEDAWVGGVLSFGETGQDAAVFVTNHDERCAMVNYDPDSARPSPEVLRTIVAERGNKAGVYATVVSRGRLAVGQPIFLDTDTPLVPR